MASTEDYEGSERVRFDDNVSFIITPQQHGCYTDKTSIGSARSWQQRHSHESPTPSSTPLTEFKSVGKMHRSDTISNDSVIVDIEPKNDSPRRNGSTAATLRRLFFHSNHLQDKESSPNRQIESSITLPVIPEPGIDKAIPIVSKENIKIEIAL